MTYAGDESTRSVLKCQMLSVLLVKDIVAMSQEPSASSLLKRVKQRLQACSFASAGYYSVMTVLAIGILAVLVVRLLGLIPADAENPRWLVAMLPIAAFCAWIFQRRIRQANAASAIDDHAQTKDLFLTLSTLSSSAGEYQPLVAHAAEQKAEFIEPAEVVPFNPWARLGRLLTVAGLMAVAVWWTPQLDPFGRVEAAQEQEEKKNEISTIRRANQDRREQLKKKSRQADESSDELEASVAGLKKDFRKMRPTQIEANAKVLTKHRSALGDQWKAQSSEQLRQMLNRPLSRQQMGGSRSQKMNQWLDELQQGNTEGLQKELKKAQETMQALMEATDPEERKKLASQLKKDLQDLKKFASDKAGSKDLAAALSKALKSLEAGQPQDSDKAGESMSPEAMEALKESLEISKDELEQLAQSAEGLKKVEEALKTIQQAQSLNQQGQMDGEKLEGLETLSDYAEMYAQMMDGQGGSGDKDVNEGGEGQGAGGETAEDDSDPEGYKDEKTKTRIKAGKVLLSIKTKEHAEETDFDPDALRKYQASVSSLKDGVQSAIENEEIPPGYVDSIKSYFDKIEDVDPGIKGDK